MKILPTTRNPGVPALTVIAILGVLLSLTTVQAATVQKEGDLATGITDLTIGSNTYDVTFTCNTSTADADHWGDPPVFDFNDSTSARNATEAIVVALNAEGGVLRVGCGPGQNEFSNVIFRLAFDLRLINVPLPDLFKPDLGDETLDLPVLAICEGVTGDTSSPGVWVVPGEGPDDCDLFPWASGSVSPLFTLVSGGGAGNSPPTADVGGPYSGFAGDEVSFDGSGSSDSDGNIVTWDWNFGDDETGSGETTTHTYADAGPYNVTLTVTDDANDTASDDAQATIGDASQPPVADAGGPYTGSVGAAVRFDGSHSTDPDGNVASWAWDFGDGLQGTGPTPKHTYDAPGPYTVTLTVTDNSSETDRDVAQADIGIGNLPPQADAGGPYIGAADVPKQFDGTGSSDPDGDTLTYAWNFGDSNTGVGPRPTHTYAVPASYTVSVTVTDDDNASDSSETTAIIGDGNPPATDRLVDLVTLDDIGGSAGADLAVLDVALVNGDQLSATVHVHDGSTGNQLYEVDVSDSWRSIAIDAAMSNGGPRLAILQRDGNGDIRVRLLNATDGSETSTVAYFDNTWTPIDILSVRDAGGPGIEGIGVLAENPAGQQAIELHTVTDGALVNQVLYFNDVWKASYAVDLGEFNGNGRSEMAVLATNNAGKHAVETRDALSGKQISRYFFLGPTNMMKGLAQSADVDGNGKPELIVLGNKDAANNTANTAQVKDVKTDALISKPGSFAPPFVGFALRNMEDVDGNASPEMVIGAFDNEGNVTRVQVRDVLTGTLTLNTGILSTAYDPRDLEILEDVSGNGIQELAAAGLDRETLAIRVQTRDGQDGTLLLNIDIN